MVSIAILPNETIPDNSLRFYRRGSLKQENGAEAWASYLMKKLKASNNFLLGGAILNEDGEMCGSSLVLQFENDAELDSWLENEPYLLKKVWESVEVKPFRVAEV